MGMKQLIKILLLLTLGSGAYGSITSTEVGNHAGLTENNFVLAYHNIKEYIYFTLVNKRDTLKPDQKNILTKIYNSLNLEKETRNQVVFLKASEHPGLFPPREDGTPGIAYTLRKIGAIIYINKEQLYPFNSSGVKTPLTISTVISVLVHEFGHHHGVLDEMWLDKLGYEVATSIVPNMDPIFLSYTNDDIRTQIIRYSNNVRPRPYFDNIMINDGESWINLLPMLKKHLYCPMPFNRKVVGLLIMDGYWKDTHTLNPYLTTSSLRTFCYSKHEGIRGFGNDIFRLKLHLKYDSNKKLKIKALTFSYIRCDLNPTVCTRRNYYENNFDFTKEN